MASITNDHKLGGLENRDSFFQSSGGQRLKSRFASKVGSFWKLWRESVPGLSSSFWWLPGHSLACRQSPLISTCLHMAFFPLCLLSFSSKDTSHWRYDSPLCRMISSWDSFLTFAKALFPNQVTSQVWAGQILWRSLQTTYFTWWIEMISCNPLW